MNNNDHDILVTLAADVKDIKRAVEGNGQPGLIERVTTLEALLTKIKYGAAATFAAALLAKVFGIA